MYLSTNKKKDQIYIYKRGIEGCPVELSYKHKILKKFEDSIDLYILDNLKISPLISNSKLLDPLKTYSKWKNIWLKTQFFLYACAGILLMLFGYKYFSWTLAFMGYCIGAFGTYIALDNFLPKNNLPIWIMIVCCCVAAL